MPSRPSVAGSLISTKRPKAPALILLYTQQGLSDATPALSRFPQPVTQQGVSAIPRTQQVPSPAPEPPGPVGPPDPPCTRPRF
ncbi:hypothetical protein DPEC_G00238150 [Dallia pectoralis]|uniref:Uncharacterized protein n=1 Tax=Dallia pectoralis TaxID=75939 RepID=A0ACC2FZ90_DALPE|nr:hypothetical protein DPEC_G00238150 [Dallia pectoralis]